MSEITLPNLSINTPDQALVKSEELVGYYNEILADIREDKKEIDEVTKNFIEMVTNEGDSSTSSKEAMVNLLKMKADMSDKKIKVVELLMKAFMNTKVSNNVSQFNQTIVGDKRSFLKSILQEKKSEN